MALNSRASASRTLDGIVVKVPRELDSLAAQLIEAMPVRRDIDGTLRIAATHSALDVLTRIFRDHITLDASLKRAMVEVHKRRIVRQQIVGPRASTARGPFVASPSKYVFHRTNCEWAGEIGAEMLVLANVKTATERGFRPCRLCRPLDARKPTIPDELRPYDDVDDEPKSLDVDSVDPRRFARSAFVGSARSLIYHVPQCEWALELGATAMEFSGRAEAEALGYRPCHACRPADSSSVG